MDVYRFRQAVGMNQSEFAEWIGVRQATVSEWETGTKKPSPLACRLLTLLEEIHRKEAEEKEKARAND